MIETEINELLSGLLDKEGEVICEKYIDENFLYVFTIDKDLYNKRIDSSVGGKGPLMINLKTKEFKRIHYLDFPSHLIKEVKTPNINEIINSILERKYITNDDLFNFLLNEYGEQLTKDYSFFDCDDKVIGLRFNNRIIQSKFKVFFKKLKTTYLIDEELRIMVKRRLG